MYICTYQHIHDYPMTMCQDVHLFFSASWAQEKPTPVATGSPWRVAMALRAMRALRGRRGLRSFVRGITVEAMRLNTPLKETRSPHSWTI